MSSGWPWAVGGWMLRAWVLAFSLALLGMVRLRTRGAGRYWAWREETAFGRGRPADMIGAVSEYARWCVVMRRIGRGRS